VSKDAQISSRCDRWLPDDVFARKRWTAPLALAILAFVPGLAVAVAGMNKKKTNAGLVRSPRTRSMEAVPTIDNNATLVRRRTKEKPKTLWP
jgi:hypothetical protein